MAKVPLRSYNREIESLIDQGRPSEAIAHCHQILQKYSKHLATYRLLAKAHLELKHYAEAVDIFGRVLMAVPDDFVSHVGMSIICDEQKKLDDAIWHMQRAFESQPSNPAIQGELQRLFGRRDGIEPPKVRMTRGALATMYLQGELYPQAIAEGHAVLSSDPARSDMQVLLARAYFRSGQKASASEMCAELIKKYPYSFDANRIMIELLPATPEAAESRQLYRTRVGELDPYTTFGSGSVFKTDEVSDTAINLDKLDYTGGEEPEVQKWNSPLGAGGGISAAAAASSAPGWLAGGFSGTPASPASQGESNTDIPDFLREAGWAESNMSEQPVSFFDEESPNVDLTPAEIPEWLKGQVPVNTAPAAQPEPAQSLDIPEWLQTPGTVQEDNVPDWLKSKPAKTSASESAKVEDAPDWLNELEDKRSSEPALPGDVPDWLNKFEGTPAVEPAAPGDVPDWLGGLDETKTTTEPAQGSDVLSWMSRLDEKQTSEPAQPGEVPDWQPELDTDQINKTAQPGDIPVWLTGLDEKKITEPVPEGITPDWQSELDTDQMDQPAQSDNVADWLSGLDEKAVGEPVQAVASPDWLKGLDSDENGEPAREVESPAWLSGIDEKGVQFSGKATSVESLGATAQEQDDAVAWLESLAAKQGAKPEEMVTDPNKRSEATPEWVSQAQDLGTPAASVENLGSTAQEQDDAVAWLESLAAKHGAKPEEMVTDPNKRSEATPEWVSQAQSIAEVQLAPVVPVEEPKPEIVENALNIGEQFFAEFENTFNTAPATDETSAWLLNLGSEEKQQQPLGASEDLPDWLREPSPQPDQFEWQGDVQNRQEPIEQVSEQDQLVNTPQDVHTWLSETESLFEKPELQAEALQEQDAVEQIIEQGQSLGASEDLPDWLREPSPQPDQVEWQGDVQNGQEPIKQVLEQDQLVNTPQDVPTWLSKTGSLLEKTELQAEALQEQDAVEQITEQGQPLGASEDLPDWLSKPSPQPEKTEWANDALDQVEVEKQDSEVLPSNLPSWLNASEQDAGPQSIYADQNLPENDLASWLNSLDDEPGLPFDALPTPDSILFSSHPSRSETRSKEPEFIVESNQPDWMTSAGQINDESEDDLQPSNFSTAEELPAWLQESEETRDTIYTDDDAPPWLRREQWEAEEEPQQLQPTSPSDWHRLEPTQAVTAPAVSAPIVTKITAPPKQETLVESQKPFTPPSPEPSAQPDGEQAATPAVQSAQKKKISLAIRKLQPDSGNTILALTQAKGELDRGDIPAALSHYAKLIKKGKHIEETIRDLAESIYRYPVEVGILQTLGDAYMRANRLKEALEAYNKAEELIR